MDYEEALQFMLDEKNILSEKKGNKYINFNFLGSWKINYKTWTQNQLFPTIIIKYEDLQENAILTFEKIVKFINSVSNSSHIKFNKDKALKSITNCSFDKLKRNEEINGFAESVIGQKTGKKIKFFNLGKDNNWRKNLPKDILKKMNNIFSEDLEKLNYKIF